MIVISSSVDVDSIFWVDIMIVIIVFVVVSHVVVFVSTVSTNDNSFSIIKFVENVDYFDFNYENSIDIDQSIVTSNRHNFYRNVFIFIDHLKNLKKIVFENKVKNLIIICFKNEALRWFETKFIEIKKNYFREIFIERWCTQLIKRFKKRTLIAFKKFQTKIYIYVNARRDKTSRTYVQNIFRHVKVVDYSLIYH